MNKRIFPILILILALMLPIGVSATEPTAAPEKRIEGYYEIDSIPETWNPLEELTAAGELLLSLTADRLYFLSKDGSTLTPSLAAELPLDVTEEFAGTFNIPEGAKRGFAFRIQPDPAARWEDGAAVTAADLVFTLNQLIDRKALNFGLANLEGFYAEAEKPTETVIPLREAGFLTAEEAVSAGFSALYVDTNGFWGLNSGWVGISDRTRLKDTAIPSGITEMYISGAYLYDRYLRSGASLSHYQAEFLGISAEPAYIQREDIGLIEENGSLVLILEEPTTAEALALKLAELTPVRESKFASNYGTSAATYCASGPWKIGSIAEGVLELVPNEHYHGKFPGIEADLIHLKVIGT